MAGGDFMGADAIARPNINGLYGDSQRTYVPGGWDECVPGVVPVMYDCRIRSDTEYHCRYWKSGIPKELPGFKRICHTVERSYDEIFNYSDAPFADIIVKINEGLVLSL